jgi:hypothetical protein
MTPKISGLKRLAGLYSKVEHIRSLQLRAATADVAEVVQAKQQHREGERRQALAGRTALSDGDRAGWSAAAMHAQFATLREERLDAMLEEREIAREFAATVHRASYQRKEQIDGLVESAITAEAVIEERRDQADSDDRFLSRRAWLQARDERTPKP